MSFMCLRMLEFRVRYKPENVIVTCPISDYSGSATFVYSLNFLLRSLYSLLKNGPERTSNFQLAN